MSEPANLRRVVRLLVGAMVVAVVWCGLLPQLLGIGRGVVRARPKERSPQ